MNKLNKHQWDVGHTFQFQVSVGSIKLVPIQDRYEDVNIV